MTTAEIDTQTRRGCVTAFIVFAAMLAIGLALGTTQALGSCLLVSGILFSVGLAIYMPIRGSVLKNRLLQQAAATHASSLPAPSIPPKKHITEPTQAAAKQQREKGERTAMYCPYCSKELPDDATFCLKCGKPVKGAAQSPVHAEPQWEYCSIGREPAGFLGLGWHYTADGVGPRGSFRVAQDGDWDTLIQKLVSSGWEALPPTGGFLGGHRFRRRMS